MLLDMDFHGSSRHHLVVDGDGSHFQRVISGLKITEFYFSLVATCPFRIIRQQSVFYLVRHLIVVQIRQIKYNTVVRMAQHQFVHLINRLFQNNLSVDFFVYFYLIIINVYIGYVQLVSFASRFQCMRTEIHQPQRIAPHQLSVVQLAYIVKTFGKGVCIGCLCLVLDGHDTDVVSHPCISAFIVDKAGCMSTDHVLLQEFDVIDSFTQTVCLNDFVCIRYIQLVVAVYINLQYFAFRDTSFLLAAILQFDYPVCHFSTPHSIIGPQPHDAVTVFCQSRDFVQGLIVGHACHALVCQIIIDEQSLGGYQPQSVMQAQIDFPDTSYRGNSVIFRFVFYNLAGQWVQPLYHTVLISNPQAAIDILMKAIIFVISARLPHFELKLWGNLVGSTFPHTVPVGCQPNVALCILCQAIDFLNLVTQEDTMDVFILHTGFDQPLSESSQPNDRILFIHIQLRDSVSDKRIEQGIVERHFLDTNGRLHITCPLKCNM